jgi:hypothetical protein
MFCKKCGNENVEQAQFCFKCGNALSNGSINPTIINDELKNCNNEKKNIDTLPSNIISMKFNTHSEFVKLYFILFIGLLATYTGWEVIPQIGLYNNNISLLLLISGVFAIIVNVFYIIAFYVKNKKAGYILAGFNFMINLLVVLDELYERFFGDVEAQNRFDNLAPIVILALSWKLFDLMRKYYAIEINKSV